MRIALPILIATILATSPALAHTELLRGSTVGSTDTKVATVTSQGGIQVFRGAGSKPTARPSPKPRHNRVTAGENLWIVNSADKKITGCEIRNSTQVAKSLIRCTTRKLSALRQ